MNILVVDVAASESGALSILNLYYNKLSEDKDNHYYFCVSTSELVDTDNISILSFKWVKKSWIHRLWFDHVTCRRLLKKYSIEKIFSLQNTAVPHTDLPQTIYLHQSLPFVDYCFSFFENKLFWIYQNIIGKIIIKSIKKAGKVIVQTNWMKQSVIVRCNVPEEKIEVSTPVIDVEIKEYFDPEKYHNTFFYPATGMSYKNHKVILEAVKILKERNIRDFRVVFTLDKEMLPSDCIELLEEVKEYIDLIGKIPREEVLQRYSESVLLFPSYIETLGLPLLEARKCNAPIIVSDLPFSREILKNYSMVDFFLHNDGNALSELMKKYIYE